MKDIAIIFFLLIFSVAPLFGEISNSRLQVSDAPHAYLKYKKPANDFLIAQSETKPPVEPEESSEKSPIQMQTGVVDQENNGTKQEDQTQPEKKRRVLKIANDYELAADEVLTTLIMIGGNASLQGHVTGNMLVLGGDVALRQGSQVTGTLEIIGGQVSGSIDGAANLRVSNHWEIVPAAVKLVMHPYIFWKTTTDKRWNLRLTLTTSGLFLLMYLLIAALFSKPINAISGLLRRRPIGSILFAVLMFPAIPLILTLLTLSIVGVPFMLLVLALLVPLAVFGKTVIFLTLGSMIFSGRLRLLGIIFSYILYFMATALPYIDWVTFLLVNAISIGLCLLSSISIMLPEDPRQNISWTERV